MRPISKFSRRGITLVEVLTTLLIVGVLLGVILPAIQSARESARKEECRNNLKGLALALHNYHDVMNAFPHASVGNEQLPPNQRWSWYLFIGNYWGKYGTPLIDHSRAWDDPGLRPLRLSRWSDDLGRDFQIDLVAPPVVSCPNGTSAKHSDGQPFTDYIGTSGLAPDGALEPRSSPRAGAWSHPECTTLADMRDGITHTLLAIETRTQNGCWLAGGTATVQQFNPEQEAIGREGQFGGLHDGGAVSVFADGHVRFLSAATAPNVLAAAVTIAGGEAAAPSSAGEH